jgi:hypothetical protein
MLQNQFMENIDYFRDTGYTGKQKIDTGIRVAPKRADPNQFMLGIIRECTYPHSR